MVEKH